MTGRGAGYCRGFDAPGYAGPQGYYGFGPGHRHRGGGPWRRGHWFAGGGPFGWAPFPVGQDTDRPTEKSLLEARAEALRTELDSIRKRLGELGPPPGEE